VTADHILLAFGIFIGVVLVLTGLAMVFLRDRLFSHHVDEDDEG
jgi:hypothetical protein